LNRWICRHLNGLPPLRPPSPPFFFRRGFPLPIANSTLPVYPEHRFMSDCVSGPDTSCPAPSLQTSPIPFDALRGPSPTLPDNPQNSQYLQPVTTLPFFPFSLTIHFFSRSIASSLGRTSLTLLRGRLGRVRVTCRLCPPTQLAGSLPPPVFARAGSGFDFVGTVTACLRALTFFLTPSCLTPVLQGPAPHGFNPLVCMGPS